jgi:hypothetical protein
MVQKSIALKTQGAFRLPAEGAVPTLRSDFRRCNVLLRFLNRQASVFAQKSRTAQRGARGIRNDQRNSSLVRERVNREFSVTMRD